MALTDSKILYGPFDIELLDGTVSQFARTGLVEDSVSFNGETFEAERKIGDGSKLYWEEGRELIIETILSELDPAADSGDLAKIEDSGDTITAGAFETGRHYRILTVGTTDFTAIGASANTVGVEFETTGAGTGTGTALQLGVDKITLAFSNPSKTITVSGLESVRAHLDGLKTKIVCKISKPLASEWSDVFSST